MTPGSQCQTQSGKGRLVDGTKFVLTIAVTVPVLASRPSPLELLAAALGRCGQTAAQLQADCARSTAFASCRMAFAPRACSPSSAHSTALACSPPAARRSFVVPSLRCCRRACRFPTSSPFSWRQLGPLRAAFRPNSHQWRWGACIA